MHWKKPENTNKFHAKTNKKTKQNQTNFADKKVQIYCIALSESKSYETV